MAYEGSLAVRFGGFLDDPNGFPAILYMLMAWVYYYCSGWKRVAAESLLIVYILLTQSLTAVGFLILFIASFAAYKLVWKPRPLLLLTFTGFSLLSPFLSDLDLLILHPRSLHLMTGSIDAHNSQVTMQRGSNIADWLVGSQKYIPIESWWVGSFSNFGIPWYALSLIVVLGCVAYNFSALRHSSSRQHKAVTSAILMLSVYFVLGNGNLPFFSVFPINFMFFCLSYLIIFYSHCRTSCFDFTTVLACERA